MPIYPMKDAKGRLIKKDRLTKYRVRINYVDSFKKKRQIDRVAYGLEAAKALELTLKREYSNGRAGKIPTLPELVDEYLTVKKNEIRLSTANQFRSVAANHFTPIFGEFLTIDELSISVLKSWKIEMDKKSISTNTKKAVYRRLSALLNYAVVADYIKENPLKKLGTFKDVSQLKKEMDFYTVDEFKKFITPARERALCDNKNLTAWSEYVFFNIAFLTGMREGEILALTWADIDGDVITVNKSYSKEKVTTPPKTSASIRKIQAPKALMHILHEFREECEKVSNFKTDYYICGGVAPLSRTAIAEINRKYALQAGIRPIRIHDFRHSHASMLVSEGINIQEVARRLGHSNVATTLNIYAHLYPKESERAVHSIDLLFDKT